MGSIGAKRSKKSKSKRTTLKQKYKVLRKVKEHHRKKRKEMKKKGLKPREPKDPGIPNSWPFKQELIQELQVQHERDLAREAARKEEQRMRQVEAAAGQPRGATVESLRTAAAAKRAAYELAARNAGNGAEAAIAFADNSRRAFFKEFSKVVEAADVIIEVLDARDPAGCRCLDVERFVRRVDPSKKIVILLNKIDLVPREVVEQWLKHFREELPTVAFKCSTQKQANNLGRRELSQAADASLKGSECLGADTLLQLLKNYSRNSGLKTAITVGVVGLPNVGKSSLINSLKRTRVAQVGNTPGVTKSVQEVHLDKQIKLLDSPGVVFADSSADGAAAAALRNCVKVEQMEDALLPVMEIVRRCPAKQLMEIYKVPAFKGAEDFLQHIGQARGKLKKGGTVDVQAAAKMVLQDWNDGRIPYYTLPVARVTEVAGSAAVVQEWGTNFDVDRVFAHESSTVIAGLPSLEGGAAAFFQTETVGEACMDLEAMEEEEEEEGGSGGGDGGEGPSGSDADAMDDGEAAPVVRQTRSSSRQNAQLYVEQGQFNPHAARASRKQKKKGGGAKAAAAGGTDEYDFEEEWDDAADGKGANAFKQLEDDVEME